MTKEIVLTKTAPFQEILINFAVQVSKCSSKDVITFDNDFLTAISNIVFTDDDCNRESSSLTIKIGNTIASKICLKNGFELCFSRSQNADGTFTLEWLYNNKYPALAYHKLKNEHNNLYKIHF